MKALVVITLELPEPDDIVEVLDHIDPPNIPHFDRDVRIVVHHDVDDVIKFLDAE